MMTYEMQCDEFLEGRTPFSHFVSAQHPILLLLAKQTRYNYNSVSMMLNKDEVPVGIKWLET